MSDSSRTPASSWHFSVHARRAVAERGFSMADVRLAVDAPEVTYSQSTYGPGRQVLQRGELGVVVHPATRTVITVLFRRQERWLQRLAGGAAS